MKKILLTGCNGFVGRHVVKELTKAGYDVVGLDIGDSKHPDLCGISNFSYTKGSFGDVVCLETLLAVSHFDTVFHFAWRGSAGPERSDEKIQLGNALETAGLLRVAAKHGVKRFVMAGSIMEFEVNQVTYEQGSKPGLAYIYGSGKSIAHEICKPIANALGVDLVWGYITNAYGVGEIAPRFLNTTLRKIKNRERTEFTSATQNYDFIYVEDVAMAFRLLGEKGLANKGYMIGSGEAAPLKSFIVRMFETVCPERKPVFGDIPYTGCNTPIEVFSISEIQRDCDFVPTVSFEEGIRRTYAWINSTEF